MTRAIEGIKGRAILKGALGAIIISFVLTLIITLTLHFSSLSESYIPALASLIFFVSILLGSTISSKIAGSKGLLHGLGVGLTYLAFALIIGSFIAGDTFSGGLLAKKILYAVLGSGLGGVIGVGLAGN
ncbi:putative membrane protein, TIGR04086 family [Desulfonispora thiosulfatigenes DSM 11270]|uniref:Putative membrane protein, TIGR04086 family n=1 Tax=Desulfonispora thiosulfatigenes DSM 11270 TaxID=656914 RepID=A0A1W1VMN0_DESTI|nr:TIGR04086 family membrane protein [Desulfonispora thiosulfatigenes]SMB94617.1 putative membrane protein, TIGR04086 family [Desulfonispora thiosulfatigenes DSM 11270]